MAHPNKSEVKDSINAKMRRMTKNYGEANPAANFKLPQEKFKIEGPEPHQGFGADSAAVNARSDKPARRALTANPVATLNRGGRACKPVEVASRARGGRLHGKGHKGSTHVNVVVAPQGGPGGAPPMAPPPQLAALAARPPMGGPPPSPPPAPPMAGPPPGAGGPPMMPPRKRGGHVKHYADGGEPQPSDLYSPKDVKRLEKQRAKGGGVHADAAQDKALIKKTLKDEGLVAAKARGGGLHLTAGSISGPGREEKNEYWAKHGDKKKQVV